MKFFLLMLSLSSLLAAQDLAVACYKIRMKSDVYHQVTQEPDDLALFAKCKELTLQKKAQLDDIVFVRGNSKERADVSSVLNLTYPCEREPSAMGGAAQSEPPPREFMAPISMLYIPVAYKPRDVGTTFSIEAKVAAHRKIELRFELEKVDYLGDKVFFSHRDHRGNLLEIKQPLFYNQPVSNALVCRSGEPKLVGVTHPCDGAGKRDVSEFVLHFIIAEKTL